MAEINNSQRKKIVKVGLLETFAELVDTLYGSPMGASGEHHAPGLVPDPGATAGSSKFLCEDGTWKEPSGGGGGNVSVMGASGSNHASGLVPDPGATAGTTKFLREDGTWQIPIDENTQYTAATESVDGLMSKEDKTKLNGYPSKTNGSSKFLREDGTWLNIPSAFAKIRVNLVELVSGMVGDGTLLFGIVVSVLNITDNISPISQTWAGELLLFDNLIPVKNYRVSVQLKNGYELETSYYDISPIDVGADVTKTFTYEKNRIVTGYIILDQTSNDPTKKVIDENGNTYSSGYTRPTVINTIRTLSHCYVGTFENNTMYLKQLDDTDGTMYADGTSAASDILIKNVFMRLPYFYTKTSEYATDKIKIEFWIDSKQQTSQTESGWRLWGGNDLIGKYEGNCSNESDNTTGTLRSISGVLPSSKINISNFKTKARNNGTGFTCVKWRHHNIMAILFFAYYGHTNCLQFIGKGIASNNKYTGLKNANGMADTTSNTGNTNNIVFWGLENWWGNKNEYIDNTVFTFPTLTITEDDGSTRTISTTGSSGGALIYPNKLILGDNLDTLAAPNSKNGTSSTGYCDTQYFNTSANRYIFRSGYSNEDQNGVTCIYALADITLANEVTSTRLAFIGTVEITD